MMNSLGRFSYTFAGVSDVQNSNHIPHEGEKSPNNNLFPILEKSSSENLSFPSFQKKQADFRAVYA